MTEMADNENTVTKSKQRKVKSTLIAWTDWLSVYERGFVEGFLIISL